MAPITTGTNPTHIEYGVSGATTTAGQAVYKDTADSNKFKLADANSATELVRTAYGIALNTASAGQPIGVADTGDYTAGATVGIGTIYILSGTPGGIALGAPGVTDLVTGIYTSILGIGISVTAIRLKINNSGVAVPP